MCNNDNNDKLQRALVASESEISNSLVLKFNVYFASFVSLKYLESSAGRPHLVSVRPERIATQTCRKRVGEI